MQIGYQNPLANFRAALRQIVAADTIPDYRLELVETLADPDAIDTVRRGRRTNPVRVVITRRPAQLTDGVSSSLSRMVLSTAEASAPSQSPSQSPTRAAPQSSDESGNPDSDDVI